MQLAGLMAVGATGYGLGLRFYLLAQRAFGTAGPAPSSRLPRSWALALHSPWETGQAGWDWPLQARS